MAFAFNVNKECSQCLQIFTQPRLLPCGHALCSSCQEIIPKERQLCPVCGSKFTALEEDKFGLPNRTFVETSTVAKDTFKSTENKEEEGKEETRRCRIHKEETPTLYCTVCKKVFCNKCFHVMHSSHSCSAITEVVGIVCKQAETEYVNVEKMQHEFRDKREALHREKVKFMEKVKDMETEIKKRCEEIKEVVIKDTQALLQELELLKTERLDEIELKQRRLDEHILALEKFKERCTGIKSRGAHNYNICEAEEMLRNTAGELRDHRKSLNDSKIFPLQIALDKTDIQELLIPISSAIGKLSVACPYRIERATIISTKQGRIHGMASLQDKLYLLSGSILIHRAEHPNDFLGKIWTYNIKSPTGIVSCHKTSRLYIHDKGNACIWKVSLPDQQVTRWFDKVKESCALSVTPNGEILMVAQSADPNQPVAVEIYNQNAILTERVELPKNIQSLKSVYKLPSGCYIGVGEQSLYKFKTDGASVCQSDIINYQGVRDFRYAQWLERIPYHFLLISLRSGYAGSRVSMITSDLAFQRNLPEIKEESLISVCYVKSTRKLAVLNQVQVEKGDKLVWRRVVVVYNVI